MEFINQLLDEIKKYSPLGEKKLNDGTQLIGHAPHIAPQAWLHVIHPGLSLKNIELLEKNLDVAFPESLKYFYKCCNGIEFFITTISIYGFRENFRRDLSNAWQPFDIQTVNLEERPTCLSKEYLIIGGYDWDGSYIVINLLSGVINRIDQYDCRVLNEWEGFNNMIYQEFMRLTNIFDENGKQIDESFPTTPD